ncbi:MAG TPA: hypothetical protein VGA99_00135, partial [bacterium]
AWWSKLVDAMFYLGEKWGAAYQPEELVLWTSEPVVKNFSTGWGLATRLKTGQGWKVFKRPAFNIFEMLGSLGNERLAVGGSNFGDPLRAFATRQEDGSVQILVYHIDEWDTDNASPDSQQVNLVVENLPFSDFSVQCYMIDESHSNSFTVWKSMGKPEILDPKQAELLQKRDDLEMYEPVAFEQSPGRDFKKDFKLQSNSVALFILSKGRLVTLKGGTVDVQ